MSLKQFMTFVDVAKKSGYKSRGSTLVLPLFPQTTSSDQEVW